MQILGPHPRPTEPEAGSWSPQVCILGRLPSDCDRLSLRTSALAVFPRPYPAVLLLASSPAVFLLWSIVHTSGSQPWLHWNYLERFFIFIFNTYVWVPFQGTLISLIWCTALGIRIFKAPMLFYFFFFSCYSDVQPGPILLLHIEARALLLKTNQVTSLPP